MSDNKKDKIIYGLIIAVVLLLSNYIYTNNIGGIFKKDERISLIDQIDAEEKSDDDSNIEEEIDHKKNEIMKVHISGEITNPGVYEVEEGQRLEDLVKIAGGLTERANDRELNLAQRLEDQMKIYIPNKDEDIPLSDNDSNYENLPVKSVNSGLVNINTASKDELMTLPNIGEKRAEAIIEYRKAQKFESIDDIKNVTGIGDKFFEALKDLITI